MKSILKILLIFTLFSNNIFSQTNLAKTNISKGNFVDAPCSQGGKRKTGVLTFSNGDKFIGEFKNDTLSGLAKKIFVNGTIEQGKWKKGILIEKYDLLEFYKDGCIKESCRNKINGECDVYYPNQKRKSIKYYENSKLKYERFWNEYGDGFKKIVNYDLLGKLNGEYITYNLPTENGENSLTVSIDTIGQYLNGKRDGEWKKRYPGSNLDQSVFIYQDGSIISEIQFRYSEGQNLKFKESFFKDNKKLKIINYSYHLGIDKFIKYEEIYNGNFIIENAYANNGKFLSYTQTKSLLTNKKEGFDINYFDNGNINTKSLYKDDNLISQEMYYENGNKKIIHDSKKTEEYNSSGTLIYYKDKITNKGFIIFNDGGKWEGDIIRGKMATGKGVFYFSNGDKYIGIFNENQNIADGNGEYQWSNGTKYVGNFKDGKPFGNGIKYFANGDIYIGVFNENEDIADGKGEYYWRDGKKYVGNFVNGELNGIGVLTYNNGIIKQGEFKDGLLVNDFNEKTTSQTKSVGPNNRIKSNIPVDKETGYPIGWEKMSLKELSDWVDNTEEGLIWAKKMMSGVIDLAYEQGMAKAMSSSSSSSSSSRKETRHIYICTAQSNRSCCKLVASSSSGYPKTGCCPRTDGNGCSFGHSWSDVGEEGEIQYVCSYCSISINLKSYPRNDGCCSGAGGCIGHSWREVK